MTSWLTALLTATTVLVAGLCWPWLRPADDIDPLDSAMSEPLRQPITLEFSGQPLDEVLADLSRQSGVPILLDDDVRSLWPDEFPRVAADWRSVTLAAALDELLATHGLTLSMEKDVVRVVADAADASRLVSRFYSTAPPSVWASREPQLLKLILSAIAVDSWDWFGGPGVVRHIPGGILVIHHPEVHREIATVLARVDRWRETREDTAPFWLSGRMLEFESEPRISREKLATPVSLDVVDMPLRDLLGEFVLQTEIPIVINETDLRGLGLSADTPVTTRHNSVPLDEALRDILAPMHLGFYEDREVLWVTDLGTRCPADALRAYPLVELQQLGEANIEDLIMAHIEPDTWFWVGGTGFLTAVGSDLLVVSHEPLVHDKIDEFLAELRGAMKSTPAKVGRLKETEVARALRQPGALEFLDATFEDVVHFISERYGIAVRLDRHAIADAGVSGRTRVTGDFREPTLARSLESLLSPFQLEFHESREVLWITAPYNRSHFMRTQVFAVPAIVDGDVGSFRCRAALDGYDSHLRKLLIAAVGDWEEQNGIGHLAIVRDVLVVTHRDEARATVEQILSWLQRRDSTLCPICHPASQRTAAELLEEIRNAENAGSRLIASVIYLRAAGRTADTFVAVARELLDWPEGDREFVRELLRHEFWLLGRQSQLESTNAARRLLRGADNDEIRARIERCFRGYSEFDIVLDTADSAQTYRIQFLRARSLQMENGLPAIIEFWTSEPQPCMTRMKVRANFCWIASA